MQPLPLPLLPLLLLCCRFVTLFNAAMATDGDNVTTVVHV